MTETKRTLAPECAACRETMVQYLDTFACPSCDRDITTRVATHEKRTPGPFSTKGPNVFAGDLCVAACHFSPRPLSEGMSNAAFIKRACNAFDSDQATIRALREALERIMSWIDESDITPEMKVHAEAALALAKQNTGGPS